MALKEVESAPPTKPVKRTVVARAVPIEETPPPKPAAAPKQKRALPPVVESDPPLVKALRHYLRRESARALREIKKHGPEAQKLLSLLVPLAARLSQKKIEELAPEELMLNLEQLRVILQQLQNRASLQLKKLCFCHSIERFGVYKPYRGQPAFEMGTKGRAGELVQIYVEVANFTNLLRGAFFETVLTIQFEIFDHSKGKIVWKSQENRVGPEQSRSRRHDCFLNCYFRIPAQLALGQYTLRLIVSDVTDLPAGKQSSDHAPAHRTVSQTLDFEVKAHNPRS